MVLKIVRLRMVNSTNRWFTVEGGNPDDVGTAIANSDAIVVKQNRQRTVSRVTVENGAWYLKSCRVDGVRAWFRELFRGPKSRLEFQNAQELARRGISAVAPIAWSGRRWPSPSQIVTRGVPNAMPLNAYLECDIGIGSTERRRIAIALAQFFATMYSAGVVHPDPHPGNLLVSFDGTVEPKFTLLDVHAVRFAKRLSVKSVVENLVLFNRWFAMRSSRSDRLRFWIEFSNRFGRDIRPFAKELERRTLASNLRFWSRRFGRYVGTNREFKPIRSSEFRGYVVRDWLSDAFDSILQNPDLAIENHHATVLKSSRSSRVVSFSLRVSEREKRVVFKRIPMRSWLSGLKNRFRNSSVLRSWSNAHSLRDRGLPSPRPLLVFHRYRLGMPCEGYLLVEEYPHAIPFADAVRSLATLDPDERLQILSIWVNSLGRMLRLMHDRGMAHCDCKAANVLVSCIDSDPRAWLPTFIDLVGASSALQMSWSKRHRDLARLAMSFLASPQVTNSHRLRFLRTYLATVPGLNRNWKPHWIAIERLIRAKVKRNVRRNRKLG